MKLIAWIALGVLLGLTADAVVSRSGKRRGAPRLFPSGPVWAADPIEIVVVLDRNEMTLLEV